MKTAEEYLPAESDLAFEGGIMPPDVPQVYLVADYEAQIYQNSKNLNTRENDTRNTKTAIEYTCC